MVPSIVPSPSHRLAEREPSPARSGDFQEQNVPPGLSPADDARRDAARGESTALDFHEVVRRHYESLYRFARSLTRVEADACDLTQQTFYVWATKGHQLRDESKVKTWLFTTLHREFLRTRRRRFRFPHLELGAADSELPSLRADVDEGIDSAAVLKALDQVDEVYRAPLTLFYMEEHSYKEIAEILGARMGTVQSRISRGKEQMRRALALGRGS